jgi:hypothetical protein
MIKYNYNKIRAFLLRKYYKEMVIIYGIIIEYTSGERLGDKEFYSYDELFNQMPLNERQNFYNDIQEDSEYFKMYCSCSGEKTPMTLVNGKNGLYLKSANNTKQVHKPNCTYEGTTNSKPNWIEKAGKIDIYLEYNPHIHTAQAGDGEGNSRNNHHGNTTHDKITTYAMIKRILQESWDKYVFFNRSLPSLKDLQVQIKSTINKIHFGKISATDIYYYKGKIGQVYAIGNNYNCQTLIILPYSHHELNIDGTVTIHCYNNIDSYNNSVKFDCSDELWNNALISVREMREPYFIGGWVKAGEKDKDGNVLNPKFTSLAIIPISNKGMVCESEYERVLYNELHKLNRLVQKPYSYTYYPQWRGLPDGLLIDTEPNTIIEVFGMSANDESYHIRKQTKIDRFTYLQNKGRFGFWYWLAYQETLNLALLPSANIIEVVSADTLIAQYEEVDDIYKGSTKEIKKMNNEKNFSLIRIDKQINVLGVEVDVLLAKGKKHRIYVKKINKI